MNTRASLLSGDSVAIIGAGKQGTSLARAATDAGLNVWLAGSGSVERLALTAQFLAPGAVPAVTSDAVAAADIVILALPFHRLRELDPRLLDGKIVVDSMNYWEPVDGHDPEVAGDPAGSSVVVQRWFAGARVTKSLNQLGYHEFEELRRPRGAPDRVAQAVAGDDPEGRAIVLALVDRLGFDAVDAGSLANGANLGPGTPAFGASFDAPTLRSLITPLEPAKSAA
jgi:predicted dinucleotide-binding enzyme